MNNATTPSTNFRFSKTTLANGLDVICRREHQLPIVAINLWYHVGSKNEERHQRGFTHLFEHLMFEGSAHYPGDFFKHLQPLGANINGSTSSDRTNYFVDLPTAHANERSPWSRTGWRICSERSTKRSSRSRKTSSRTSTARITRIGPTEWSGP